MKVRRFNYLGRLACGVVALWVSSSSCSPGPVEEASVAAGVTMDTSNPKVEEATFFAFDDVSVPFLDNLVLTMHSPRKHSQNPLVKLGSPGEPDEWSVQFYGSIIRHQGKFKLWYVAADEEAFDFYKDKRGFYGWQPAYAESEDGINWVKPKLGLVEYKGSKDNNLVLLEPPGVMGLHLAVLHEPEDPDPSRRFKMMLYVRWAEGDTSVPLFSEDGHRWQLGVAARFENYKLMTEDLVLPAQHFEQGGLYKWKGLYYLPGQQLRPWVWLPNGQAAGRLMTIFRSPDLIHWSDTRTLAFVRHGYRSAPAGQGEEAHEPAGVWNRGNVLLATYGLWHGAPKPQDRSMDLGFLISNDGLHFREPEPDFVFISRGPDGSWDQGGLIHGQGYEQVDDETFIYYGHWDLRLGTDYRPRGGLGLVTLEQDRFGSLSLKDPIKPAALVTNSMRVAGTARVYFNASGVSKRGWFKVELLDAREKPLLGYSGEVAALVRRSGLRVPVSWEGRDGISGLDGNFKIRVSFEGDQRQDLGFHALYVSTTD